MLLNKLKYLLIKVKNKVIWKKKNKHNQTWPQNVFNIDCIEIGNMTWGAIKVNDYMPKNKECTIHIGNYCSIADNVVFIRGGEHRIDRISTFLFKNCYGGYGSEDNLKAITNIVVEDDVWIGYGVIILSGSYIGQGSVIGAGSVVRGKIPPYSVYINDRVVKNRFDVSIINKLINLDYSKVDDDFIKKHIDLYYQKVTQQTVDDIITDQNKLE